MLSIYAISDSITELSELAAKSIISQFELPIVVSNKPFIDTPEKVYLLLESLPKKEEIIIISSVVLPEIDNLLRSESTKRSFHYFSIITPNIQLIDSITNHHPLNKPGLNIIMNSAYSKKISAMEFAINNDDQKSQLGFKNADLVLIGVSRTSKTPLSLYLAYKGLKVINIPLIPEISLPPELFTFDSSRIFSLTIDAIKLVEIREKRLKKYSISSQKNTYSNYVRVLEELEYADKITRKLKCRTINVSNRPIEETAQLILSLLD